MELIAPFSLCEVEQIESAGSQLGEMENDMPAGEDKPGSDGGSVVMQECNELKRVWMEYLDFVEAFQ